jgi:hypothetical protein
MSFVVFTLGSNVLIFDNFNIDDGPLSPQWASVDFISWHGGQAAQIYQHQVCASTQSIAILANPIPLKESQVTYTFWASAVEGFESYYMINSTVDGPTMLIGCDGGNMGRGYCTPAIISSDQNRYWSGEPVALATHTNYFIEVNFSPKSDYIQFTLYDSFRSTQIFSYDIDTSKLFDLSTFAHLGFQVGRNGITCGDDFLIQEN